MALKNNLYNIFGGAGRALIFILTIPLMINFMGSEKFGVWALITSIGNIALLLDIGIASTVMYFIASCKKIFKGKDLIAEYGKVVPVLFLINFFFSGIITFSFLFLTREIAIIFLSEDIISENVIIALKVIGIYSATTLTQHFFSGIIQGHDEFLRVNVIKFFNILCINLGILFLSYFEATLSTLTYYMLFISILTLSIYVFFSFRKINFLKLKPQINIKKINEIFNYSGTTWLGYLGGVIFTQMDKIIVGKVSDIEVVGIYSAIISITSYISSISTVGLQPIIPRLTELWIDFKKKKSHFVNEYKIAHQFNAFLVFFASVFLLFAFRPLLIEVMKVDIVKYPKSVLAFQIAIIIYAFNALSVPGFYSLMAMKKTKHLGIWQILGALVALCLIYFLGLKYGLLGVIFGNIGLLLAVMFNFITSKAIFNNYMEWIYYICKPLLIFLFAAIIFIWFEGSLVSYLLLTTGMIMIVLWFFKENKTIWHKIKKLVLDKSSR